MNKYEKVIFLGDNKSDQVESMWGIYCDDKKYKIDNIPFYVSGIALNDIVITELSNGDIIYQNLVQSSGHSTIRILFLDTNSEILKETRSLLSNIGCSSEISDTPQLIAVDIPPSVDYSKVKKFLEEGMNLEKWDYEEACLGFLQ